MDIKKLEIPTEKNWHMDEYDDDVQYFKRLVFGKHYSYLLPDHFGDGRSIERASELLYAPRIVFQYYIQAFVEYIFMDEAKRESDTASPFLNLLLNRLERDPESVKNIYPYLKESLDFVAKGQQYFEAPVSIYGNFNKKVKKIRKLCE